MALEILLTGQDAENGFYETDSDGNRSLNSTKTRGRMYRALDQYTPALQEMFPRHGQRVHQLACLADAAMPAACHNMPSSTHALVLYYATNRGMGEHRDNSKNDGSSDQPVISFHLGKAVDVSVRHEKHHEKVVIRLESGDALLLVDLVVKFSTPCPNSCPIPILWCRQVEG